MVSKKATGALICLALHIGGFAQDTLIIRLRKERIPYAPKNYFIASVKDDREDTSRIGWIRKGPPPGKVQWINLEHGVTRALTQIIHDDLQQDTATTALELHVTRFLVEGNAGTGSGTSNTLALGFALYHEGSKLIEYTGGGNSASSQDASRLLGEMIRGNLAKILQQFDEWWLNNKAYYTGQKNQPTVRVDVGIDQDEYGGDFISYSMARPLTLDDFQGIPDEKSHAAASTFSMVSLKYSSVRTISNEILVDVSVSVQFNKNKSWFRREARNPQTLDHEQRHFDLSAIKACELVETIRHFPFTVEHFTRELDSLHKKIQRELDDWQNQYDEESKHGSGLATQEKWDLLVREKLLEAGCFHS